MRYGFFAYYWTCIRHFGKEVWRTGRTEIFSSLGVSTIVFLISWLGRDASAGLAFKIAVVANACWLALFALGHVVRAPWLMHHDSEINRTATSLHWGWGIFGASVLVSMIGGAAAGGVWLYATTQPRLDRPPHFTPTDKDAEINYGNALAHKSSDADRALWCSNHKFIDRER
jgi:hypothetical protein